MEQFIHLVNEMSPYLLLGFLIAGLLHVFIPGGFYSRYLSTNSFRSVVNAALFGIPLPLCSCGVIPTAMSLHKEGASRGATVSFLIATPQTGIDSILATYGLMGLPFAIIRPIAALVTALLGGMLSIIFPDKRKVNEDNNAAACQDDSCYSDSDNRQQGLTAKLREAFRYAFVFMMQDIGKWLVVGLIVAALITLCIPTEWFAVFHGNTLASMLLVLCIAIPMYVCATGSIPIAVALMLKGLTPGAALVLLMAGPACNMASMLIVRKSLGIRTLLTYLFSIIVGAISFGLLIDYLQFHTTVDFMANLQLSESCCVEPDSWWSWACTVLLCLFLVNALVIERFRKRNDNDNKNHTTMKTFHIEGMSCNHCRTSAEKAILAVSGVTSASVDLQKKEAYVEGTAIDDAICKAIEEVGFTATKA